MTKYSDFTTLKIVGTGNEKIHIATVKETTGFWIWKKATVRTVYKKAAGLFWYFVDTGRYTAFEIERLARVEEMRKLLNL